MKYIVRDRNSKKNIIIESSKTLNFFYDTLLGRIILKPFISKTFSNLMGKYMNSKYSLKRVDKFIDNALVNNYSMVRIIHGMGTGVLRNGVRKMLDKNKYVKSYRDGGANEGGLGATLVYFE